MASFPASINPKRAMLADPYFKTMKFWVAFKNFSSKKMKRGENIRNITVMLLGIQIIANTQRGSSYCAVTTFQGRDGVSIAGIVLVCLGSRLRVLHTCRDS